MSYPYIIQGGMGIGVSGWPLAHAVSRAGQMGVVSGTVLNVVFSRRLQNGDPGGHLRKALKHFPVPEVAQRVFGRYFIDGGKLPDQSYKAVPLFSINPSLALTELTVVANFVEVWLAKQAGGGPIGINFLEKIQMPNLSSIYGAMLAGVDFVLMGAGIPREIPGILDTLAGHDGVSLRLDVEGAAATDDFRIHFNPLDLKPKQLPKLNRPKFLAIIASAILATSLTKKSTGKVDGFVVEGPTAGGHNAPPRGDLSLSDSGEPIYGPRDAVDYEKIKSLGLPFWLAGSYASSERIKNAIDIGACGAQVGTAFAFCRESSLADEIKRQVIDQAIEGQGEVFTDPVASPTGFPFKVVRLEGSLSEAEVYEARPRRCDLGYLRQAYRKTDGSVGYRCPAEPVEDYLKKGGNLEDTVGRKCLCNGLMSNLGLAQTQQNGYVERPIVTAGDDLNKVAAFIKPGDDSYSAADVIEYLTPLRKD